MGITIERTSGIHIIMLCPEGDVDIEEVAHRNPEKIFKLSVDTLQNLYSFQIINMVKKIGLTGKTLIGVVNAVFKLYQLFKEYDGLIAEINPLVITENYEIFCVDAVLEVDDSALFRHPELNKRKLNKMSERDKGLMEKGAIFVKLNGNIGLICSGAELAMDTRDMSCY